MIIVEDESQIKAVRNDVLDFVSSNIFPAYGVNIYPIVLSVDEYLSELSEDVFIMDVHSRGEVLFGEKPRRFG
ncbi:MAG: hypothetical protein ACUVTE_07595 [Candidatus Bathycorpusculaceae bacterium]